MADKKKNLLNKLQEVGNASQLDLLHSLQQVETPVPQIETPEEKPEENKEVLPDKEGFIAPLGYELRPERKSQRLQLRLTPSLLERVRKEADSLGISVNVWIVEAMEKHLEG